MFTTFLSDHGLPIAVQARLSGRSRSSFYRKRLQPEKDVTMYTFILERHLKHPFEGYKTIARNLARQLGYRVNPKRVYRLMRLNDLKARSSRRKRQKNQYLSNKSSLPNRMKELPLTGPDQVWAGDFTHFTYKRRTYYLATIMDIYTRQIVGWHVSSNHSVELVLEALRMAIGTRSKAPTIFHSDHGSEYLSDEYLATLAMHDITPSNSAKGKPWQNGHVESWNYRFKEELEDPNRFKAFEYLFEHFCSQIHYYNHGRIHSVLKMTPDDFYEKNMQESEELIAPQKAA